jgi:hypothetical protein
MRIKTPQLKLDLRIEEAVLDQDTLVLKGLAGFLPCEAHVSAAEARHLLRLLFRRDTLRWTLRALFARRTGPG